MDPSSSSDQFQFQFESTPPPAAVQEEEDNDDEWDTDGFVIPSLGIAAAAAAAEEEESKTNQPDVKDKPFSPDKTISKEEEEKIYLGPHGAPPSQQESGTTGRKQRFKQKLREADGKFLGTGRENKVDNLRQLVGNNSKGNNATMLPKTSAKDWLDPHCHEAEFERSYSN